VTLTAAEWAEVEALERFVASRRSAPERYCPHKPSERQRAFIDVQAREALYGGAAGGGKSDALLMAALEHVDVPGYAALLLRRTYADLKLPGALMDRAREWLQGTDATWSADSNTWHFPGGGSLTFGYLDNDNDVFRYQSAEFQFTGYDELTQFTARQYTYLLSRLRKPSEGALSLVPLRARGATNPGGVGHRWVMERFGLKRDGTQVPGHHRPFVPALLRDNAHVDAAAYGEMLAELDSTTRDQLERGLWIADGQGRIYPLDPERHYVDELPQRNDWHRSLAVDLGSSESTPTTAFCVVYWHEHDETTYVPRSYKLPALDVTGCADEIRALASDWGPFEMVIVDPGGLGGGYIREFRARHHLAIVEAEKRNKLAYRKLLRGAIERDRVLLVRGQCDELEAECDGLMWNEAGTDAARGLADHCSDALLYGWRLSRAHYSRAPAPRPAPGSREADEAEAAQIQQRERERRQQRDEEPGWESW
jgi:hypothetical protein